MKNFTMISLLVFTMFLLFCGQQQEQQEQMEESGLHEEEIQYTANGDTMQGYFVYDTAVEGKRPGILVVHEWWGHNEYARQRARMLAELGYTAFALDMYGEGKQADHPEDAQKFASQVMQNMDMAKSRFTAALDLMKSQETVDAEQIGAIGYCFGGGVVLQMAIAGVDLDGVVSFHGALPSGFELDPNKVKASILVCHGAEDPFIPQEQVESFNLAMEDAGINYEFKAYPGAKHSFTNPMADSLAEKFNLPLAYNEAADQQSWEDMKAFFSNIFEKEVSGG